ncbi:hypothetical protein BB559_006584, partial [Furculomyces boomerangus]
MSIKTFGNTTSLNPAKIGITKTVKFLLFALITLQCIIFVKVNYINKSVKEFKNRSSTQNLKKIKIPQNKETYFEQVYEYIPEYELDANMNLKNEENLHCNEFEEYENGDFFDCLCECEENEHEEPEYENEGEEYEDEEYENEGEECENSKENEHGYDEEYEIDQYIAEMYENFDAGEI